MQTLNQLRTKVLNWLDESRATEGSSTYVNATNAIKQAHQDVLTGERWSFMLWPKFETFSTTSGTQIYPLHQMFGRAFSFKNTTQNVSLVETPTRNIEPSGVDYNNDVNSLRFALWSRTSISQQPTSASVITIVSTSASDNAAAKAIVVWGDTADGMQSETITPNGTTPVAGSVSFTQILGVTKSASWAGTLTVTSNSGAVTNLKLLPGEFGRSYQQIQLLYVPSGTETIQYRFYRQPKPLDNDNDITDIPEPFEDILVYDALLLMGAYDNRMDGGRASLWRGLRDTLEFNMRQTYLEGQSLGAEPRFIQETFHGGSRVTMGG